MKLKVKLLLLFHTWRVVYPCGMVSRLSSSSSWSTYISIIPVFCSQADTISRSADRHSLSWMSAGPEVDDRPGCAAAGTKMASNTLQAAARSRRLGWLILALLSPASQIAGFKTTEFNHHQNCCSNAMMPIAMHAGLIYEQKHTGNKCRSLLAAKAYDVMLCWIEHTKLRSCIPHSIHSETLASWNTRRCGNLQQRTV